MNRYLDDLRSLDGDALLSHVGLQREGSAEWLVPTLGALSVGILVGVGLGLLLAPKSGNELREDLSNKLQGLAEDLEKSPASAALPSAKVNSPGSR